MDDNLDPGARWLAYSRSPAFFLDRCGYLLDPLSSTGGPGGEAGGGWRPFRLWPSQVAALQTMHDHRLCVILKARQLGISWLTAGFALWLMLFRPAATVLFFSKRDDEAVHLLNARLRGMYEHLPPWLQAARIERDNAHLFQLSNGSTALAFPTTGGRSYTASLAIVDEADFADDLDGLINAVKPTIDAGGRLIMLSTVDKAHPESPFKRIYRAAAKGENGYTPIFLPWSARPGRTQAWYEEQVKDVRARTGGLDDLYQEYPATVAEALAPRAVDKLFRAAFLDECYEPWVVDPLTLKKDDGEDDEWPDNFPHLEGLVIHVPPEPDGKYVIGADPAEGNPESDESAAVVLEIFSGEQMATLVERTDAAQFAAHLNKLSLYYNQAPLMIERNTHGHAVLHWLRDRTAWWVLRGLDDGPGWVATGADRAMAFDHTAATLRERAETGTGLLLHDEQTYLQMAGIDGKTLMAPPGQHDDRAVAVVLALAAIKWRHLGSSCKSFMIPPAYWIDPSETHGW